MKVNFYKNKSIPLLFALGLFGFPLVASIPVFFEVDSRPISIAIRIVVLLLSLFVLFPPKKTTIKNRYFLLFLLFWFFYSIRIVFTLTTEDQLIPFMTDIEFFSFAFGTCFIPALALFNSLHNKKWDEQSIFNITFYILLITTMINIYLSLKTGYNQDNLSGRLNTSILNPITLGHTGASLIILSLYPILIKKGIRLLTHPFYVLGIIIGIIAVISSASKGPMLSLAAVLFIYLSFKLKPSTTISILVVAIIGFFLIRGTIGILQESYNLSVFDRFEGVVNLLAGRNSDYSTNTRIELYRDSFHQFLDNPLFGSGLVEEKSGFYPHNLFLESFMSTGLFGGMVFTLVSLLMVRKSVYMFRKGYPLSWVGLLAIQYFIGVIFSGSLFASYTFWLTMAFVFSIYTYHSKHGVVRY